MSDRWKVVDLMHRNLGQRHSIALEKMMTTAVKLENMQASPPFGWLSTHPNPEFAVE